MANRKEDWQPGDKYPIVKATFDLEANKQNYQRLLSRLTAIVVTPDNVDEDLTKEGREARKALEEKKESMAKPVVQEHKDILKAYRDLDDPLKEAIDRVLADKKRVSDQINKEKAIQLAEQTRIATAQTAIVNFTNNIANVIRNAKSDDDIVSVEKLIGLEKTKKNVYHEFLPDLITQLDNLRPQIREQKENIRNLQAISEREKIALDTGDIIAATELREQREFVETKIEHTGIKIHEKAFEQAITIDIVVPQVVDAAPKGRSNWKWEVTDIKLLQKKMPELVKVVPNDEAIDLVLKTKKADGDFGENDELLWNGIRFFNDRKFSR